MVLRHGHSPPHSAQNRRERGYRYLPPDPTRPASRNTRIKQWPPERSARETASATMRQTLRANPIRRLPCWGRGTGWHGLKSGSHPDVILVRQACVARGVLIRQASIVVPKFCIILDFSSRSFTTASHVTS